MYHECYKNSKSFFFILLTQPELNWIPDKEKSSQSNVPEAHYIHLIPIYDKPVNIVYT
jgi:hypothetical protein